MEKLDTNERICWRKSEWREEHLSRWSISIIHGTVKIRRLLRCRLFGGTDVLVDEQLGKTMSSSLTTVKNNTERTVCHRFFTEPDHLKPPRGPKTLFSFGFLEIVCHQ